MFELTSQTKAMLLLAVMLSSSKGQAAGLQSGVSRSRERSCAGNRRLSSNRGISHSCQAQGMCEHFEDMNIQRSCSMCHAKGNAKSEFSQAYVVSGKRLTVGDKRNFQFCGAGYLKLSVAEYSFPISWS